MKKLMLLAVLLVSGFINQANAAPVYSCSAGPCADGSTCAVTGTTFATCSCDVPFHWPWQDAKPSTANCSSGSVVPINNSPLPTPDQGYQWNLIPNAVVFDTY